MVNVPHDGHDWRTVLQIRFLNFLFLEQVFQFEGGQFDFHIKIGSQKCGSLSGNDLVDGGHGAFFHHLFQNVGRLDADQTCEFSDGDLVAYFDFLLPRVKNMFGFFLTFNQTRITFSVLGTV